MTADAKATRHDWTVPGSLPGGTTDWEAPDRWLTPDQEIGLSSRTLTAIATPGHTRGQMLAVIETRAHLELLVAQGRLASTSEDGVTFYQEAGPPG